MRPQSSLGEKTINVGPGWSDSARIFKSPLWVFLLAIHSHLYSFAPWYFYFFKFTQPLKVSIVQLQYTVKEKERKSDRKPYPPSLWFLKSIKKPQVWEFTRFCPESSIKLSVHEFGFWTTNIRNMTVGRIIVYSYAQFAPIDLFDKNRQMLMLVYLEVCVLRNCMVCIV